MDIKKCDRCGDTYSTTEDITVVLHGEVNLTYTMYLGLATLRKVDLCSRCVSDFVHWWHMVVRESGNK